MLAMTIAGSQAAYGNWRKKLWGILMWARQAGWERKMSWGCEGAVAAQKLRRTCLSEALPSGGLGCMVVIKQSQVAGVFVLAAALLTRVGVQYFKLMPELLA